MVKLTVKTIKGKKFQIEVEQTQTVREVKGVIEGTNPEFPAAQLKLIHSGQILKDDSTLEEYQIKEEEFVVCMVTKPKPAAAAPPAAASPPAPSSTPAAAAAATAPLPAAAATPAPPAAAAVSAAPNTEHIRQLTDMGFPEDQATAALRAAMGNPDVAVEYLMTGIPDNIQAASAAASQPPAPAPGAMETLDDFRGHPQFNDLKRLVQRDPAMLSSVLQMIGQQSPTLLARIHENQGEFIALMNEPVDESAPPPAAAAPAGGMGALGMMGPGGQASNPAQVAQMLQGLTPAQRAQMAAAMGVSPQQLAQVSQVIGQMPQDQFQQLMGMVSAGGMPGGGMGGMRGMPPGAGGAGGNVIRLTEEEGAAVARLTELGFDRTDAAQAYLACDKNEALAANLLLNDMSASMASAFQEPAATPSPAPAPAPAPATTASQPPAAQAAPSDAAAAPSPATGDSASTNPSAENQAQEGGDEDEDMYG